MKQKWVFITAVFLTTGFIFYQSLQPAVVSDGYSMGLLAVLRRGLSFPPFFDGMTNHILRKMAHWFEFFLQGWFLCVLLFSMNSQKKNLLGILFIGLLTAVADESIQLYIPGRAGRVEDILIDFSGTISGVGVYLLLKMIKTILRKNQKGGTPI